MALWPFFARSKKPTEKLGRPLHERIAVRDGAFDYANTPYVWVCKSKEPAVRVLRVFLAGNKSLRRYESDPSVIPAYRAFRCGLVSFVDPDVNGSDPDSLGNPYVAVHANYFRVMQNKDSDVPSIHDDAVVASVLELLQEFAGYADMPPVRYVRSADYLSFLESAGGRWRPGS